MTHLQLYLLLLFQAASGCTMTAGNQTYDFSTISVKQYAVDGPKAEHGVFSYQASFCSDRVACGAYIYGNFVRFKNTVCQGVYGKWSTGAPVKTVNGMQVTFQSTTYCTDDFQRTYKCEFNFLCDTSAGDIGSMKATQVGDTICEFSVDVHTNLVCVGSIPVNQAQGLSAGSVFLIILVVLLAVYFLAGLGYNYYRTKSIGAPHRAFWCSLLPYWTKTGCMLSWFGTVTFCKTSYRWCCLKIFNAKPENDKMATALFQGEDSQT